MIKPALFRYDSCKAFAEAFQIGRGDLVLTNEYIYAPYFKELGLEADVLLQEQYGGGEPTDGMAEAICADMRGDYRRIIGIGGGTVIDLAKLLALKTVLPVADLFAHKLDAVKEKELVLVPTTCGTGSEVTNISILGLDKLGTKLGLADDALYADCAVMVTEPLMGLPYRFFAASSIDALIHAVESSVSPKATAYTKLFGYKAIGLIVGGYRKIAADGQDARFSLSGDFLLASNYAGIAFGNAGVGAVHAMSYPLGSRYHVPHGEANYALFLAVFRRYRSIFDQGAIAELDRVLADALGCELARAYEELAGLLDKILPLKPLGEYGVTAEDIPAFTANVMEKQGRLTANNFVRLDAEHVAAIYREVL